MRSVDNLKRIAAYCGVPLGKMGYNWEKILSRTPANSQVSVSGYASIIQSLARESGNEAIKEIYTDPAMEAQIVQWLDYAVLFVKASGSDKHVAKALLEELNQYLSTRSYLVNHSLTLADVVVFHTLQDTMRNLQTLDKENYLNVSRWFHHLQQMEEIRQDQSVINFSTLQLVEWATGTHV